ncbi:Ig-like domain-containing protein [Tunturiibacter gelidiferens]|uniref:Ig-like domain-containing protein n=1 Tax=Tunturiibacter gelidiferens TaxID=3069689 RepID=UPI003D9AC20C
MPIQPSGVGLPVNISITPASETLSLGGTLQLTAILTDVTGAKQNPLYPFAWSTSNASLATVDANGLVTAYTPSDPNVLNPGGQVSISVAYPFANNTNGDTIRATATVTVLATPAVTIYSQAQSQGATDVAEAENWPGANLWSNGWKNIPESLLG